MRRVSVRELRNQTADVMDAVRGGERVTLTISGEPVADIVPYTRQVDRLPADEFLADLRAIHSGATTDEPFPPSDSTTDDLLDHLG